MPMAEPTTSPTTSAPRRRSTATDIALIAAFAALIAALAGSGVIQSRRSASVTSGDCSQVGPPATIVNESAALGQPGAWSRCLERSAASRP